MHNKLLKIAGMGFALLFLSFGALPAMAQPALAQDELLELCSETFVELEAEIKKEGIKKMREEFQDMIKNGFDVNEQSPNRNGFTAFHLFGGCTNIEVVSILLKAGGQANVREKNFGFTPLHLAAAVNTDPEVIIALVQAGANVNARAEDGITPLHLAAYYNQNPDVIMALLKIGADGLAFDSTLNTPFALAKENKAIKGTEAYWALSDAQYE